MGGVILLLAIYPCVATGLTKKLAMFNHAVNSFSKKYVKKFLVYYIKKKIHYINNKYFASGNKVKR
jgi:hypothetical protein